MADNTAKSTRRRTSTPRSKNGCITCKIRRLKCGEEKPGCLRCAKSGWTCDGYEHVAEGSSPGPSSGGGGLAPILPHPHRSTSTRSARSSFSAQSISSRSRSPSVVGLNRTPTLGLQIPPQLHRQEQLYFQVFLDEEPVTFLRLDPFFWKSVAVQQSHSTSCIRHALVALGALIKSCRRTPSGNYLLDFQEGIHRQFAMQQHEKAIRGLREAISCQEAGDSTRSIAIACLVLARLEPFIGNGGFTMQHIRYARKLIFGGEESEVRIPSIFSDYTHLNDVSIMMFFQSDMQALAAFGPDEDRSLVQTSVEIHNTSISAPTSFRDFEEAKQYQGVLIQGAFRFWYRSSLTHRDFWGPVEQNTVDIRDYFLRQIHHFHSALEALGSNPADSHGHPLQRPLSIKLSSVTAYLKLSLSLDAPETNADLLFSYFQFIVNSCQEVIDYENQYEFNAGYETFSFESRILGPLFIVALKCRDSNLRRQAISMLLHSHRRELINDSINLGNMGSWIMGIEEEGIDTIGYIPEESRTWGHSMEMDLQRKSTVVKCRVGRKIPGQWTERTAEIPCNEILG